LLEEDQLSALDLQATQGDRPPTAGPPGKDGAPHGIRRNAQTWYCYFLLGLLNYLLAIQGNVIPFLQSELHLSYRAVSLHSSAIATGMIVIGLFGERLSRRFGRQMTLWLGAGGMAIGAVLICLAPAAWASIAACGLMGLTGALIPSVVPALLADIHREQRDTAFAEATAVSYAFAILAPLATGFVLWLSLGWRYAMVVGSVYGGLLLLWFGRISLTEPTPTTTSVGGKLPPPYWAYWCLLVASVALEFCVLLWAPAFLERESGFSPTFAAVIAGGFSLGMLAGRLMTGWFVRMLSPYRFFQVALLVALFGFGIYWGIDQPLLVVAGITVLGLGIAPLYPLTLGFAINAAGELSDAASARFMLAVGLAILAAPTVLGGLADLIGLRMAHLTLPALMGAALICLLVGRVLERQKVTQNPD
jgi:MFS family permease